MTCGHASIPCTACGAGFTRMGLEPAPGERDMTAAEFEQWREHNIRRAMARQLEMLRDALLAIASLDEGPVVCGKFDEPGSAQAAREALAAEWMGPCAHGRDPWTRCDECESQSREVAWAMAAIKEMHS